MRLDGWKLMLTAEEWGNFKKVYTWCGTKNRMASTKGKQNPNREEIV
jgi:hypothetical protein